MNPYLKVTKNHQIELVNDLILIKTHAGELLKAISVPVYKAVDSFNELVEHISVMDVQRRVIK